MFYVTATWMAHSCVFHLSSMTLAACPRYTELLSNSEGRDIFLSHLKL